MTPLARSLLERVPAAQRVALHQYRYGSPEWDALPDQDPRRAAAVIVAAECWLDHCSPAQIALDLLEDLRHTDAEVRRRVRECSWDVWSTRELHYFPSPSMPTRAELQQRRGEAA